MQAIALEFRHENGALAANGSDVVTFLDGRWNHHSKQDHIHEKIAQLRKGNSKYNKQHYVGYTQLGANYRGNGPQIRQSDPNPPAWVERDPNSKF